MFILCPRPASPGKLACFLPARVSSPGLLFHQGGNDGGDRPPLWGAVVWARGYQATKALVIMVMICWNLETDRVPHLQWPLLGDLTFSLPVMEHLPAEGAHRKVAGMYPHCEYCHGQDCELKESIPQRIPKLSPSIVRSSLGHSRYTGRKESWITSPVVCGLAAGGIGPLGPALMAPYYRHIPVLCSALSLPCHFCSSLPPHPCLHPASVQELPIRTVLPSMIRCIYTA